MQAGLMSDAIIIQLQKHLPDGDYLALDLGGSLCKICHMEVKNNAASICFEKLPMSDFSEIEATLQSLALKDLKSVSATGGGSFKYAALLENTFRQSSYSVADEMESLIFGLKFSLSYFFDSCEFPCILANIGSGASFILIDSDFTYKRIGGTNLAGGVLAGIGHILSPSSSLEQHIAACSMGTKENVDILVKDIYGKGYESIGLPGDVIAGSLGKTPNYKGNDLYADVSASVVFMICSNIASLLALHSEQHKVGSIVFGGSFVTSDAVKKILTDGLDYWSNGRLNRVFIPNSGHLGCFGLFQQRHQ